MNKKGQMAVIFIILIPVFMVLAALVIDTGLNIYNEKKLKNVTEDILTNLLESDLTSDKYYERAKNIYEKNNIDTEFLSVRDEFGRIKIYNSTVYYSFLGTLFQKGNHQSAVEATGYKNDSNEIIIEFTKDDLNEN